MYECPNRLCKLHTWTKSPSICSDVRDVPVVKPVTENIWIVCSCACCCLSFTRKCSYAAGPLQSAGTITPEIKQWFTLKGCDVQILPVHLRARWKKKHENFFFFFKVCTKRGGWGWGTSCNGGGYFNILWHRTNIQSFFSSYTLQPQLNRGHHSSIMWMSSRPVLNWTSVHLYAAVQTMCCP